MATNKQAAKGHARGTKTFRELSRAQQRAAIAKAARDLKDMQRIYRTTEPGS